MLSDSLHDWTFGSMQRCVFCAHVRIEEGKPAQCLNFEINQGRYYPVDRQAERDCDQFERL